MKNPETSLNIPEILLGSSIPNPNSYTRTLNNIFRYLFLPGQVTIEGQHNIPDDEPLLIVANHRGQGDIPVVARAMQQKGLTRFIAKSELSKVPILGKKMEESWGAIYINRGNSGLDIIPRAIDTFRHQKDPYLGIFPEGTRIKENPEKISVVPSLVARVALDGNVRVLPIGIWGTGKHRQIPGFSKVSTHVGEPIEIADLAESYSSNTGKSSRLTRQQKTAIRQLQGNILQSMQNALDIARENY